MLSYFILNVNILAQSSWNAAVLMNPLPLKYTSSHYRLKGSVKSVDNMLFDKQGLITEVMDYDTSSKTTYLYSFIEMEF